MLATVGVLSQVLGIDVGPDNVVFQDAVGTQAGNHAFFCQLECGFGLRHFVDDVVECLDGIHHLVVLRGNVAAEDVVVLQVAGLVQSGPGRVGKSAAFAHFLEHDGVHASTKVFVIELAVRFNGRVKLFATVGYLRHVNLLGFVRSQEYLGLGSELLLEFHAFGHFFQGGRYFVLLLQYGQQFVTGARTVVCAAVLVAVQVVDAVYQLLRVHFLQFLVAQNVGGIVLRAPLCIDSQAGKVLRLVQLGVGTSFQ